MFQNLRKKSENNLPLVKNTRGKITCIQATRKKNPPRSKHSVPFKHIA